MCLLLEEEEEKKTFKLQNNITGDYVEVPHMLRTALPDNKAVSVNIPFSLDFHLHIMQMYSSRFLL